MIRHFLGAVALCFVPALAGAQGTGQAPTAAPAGTVHAMLMAPGLRATDLDRSIKFYGTALGLVQATTLHFGSVTEVILCSDTQTGRPALILLRDDAPGRSPPMELGNGFEKIVMRVPDLAGVAARMKAAGYPVGDIRGSGHGPSVLMIQDPDGYTLELVEGGVSHG